MLVPLASALPLSSTDKMAKILMLKVTCGRTLKCSPVEGKVLWLHKFEISGKFNVFCEVFEKKHLANEAMIVYHFSESQTKTKNKNVKGKPKEFGIRWTLKLNTILNIMHTQSYAGTSASTGCVWALVHHGDLIHTVRVH